MKRPGVCAVLACLMLWLFMGMALAYSAVDCPAGCDHHSTIAKSDGGTTHAFYVRRIDAKGNVLAEQLTGNVGDHVWSDEHIVVKPVSCEEYGAYKLECTMCGFQTSAMIEVPKGHVPGTPVKTAATCAMEGVSDIFCSRCGVLMEETVIPRADHTYGAWQVMQEPTCQEYGLQMRSCPVCSHTESRGMDKVEHDYALPSLTSADVPGYCQPSVYETRKCRWCDAVKVVRDEPATEHVFGAAISSAQFDPENECSGSVYETKTCTVCGEVKVLKDVKAVRHVWGEVSTNSAFDPAVECSGSEHAEKTCTLCGKTVVVKDVAGVKHDLGASVTVTKEFDSEVFCSGGYTVTRQCRNCGKTLVQEDTGPVKHQFGAPVSSKSYDPATDCIPSERETKTCTLCGKTVVTKEVKAVKHNLEKGQTVAPTCQSEGYTVYECVNPGCGYSIKKDTRSQVGHDYSFPTYMWILDPGVYCDYGRCAIMRCVWCDAYTIAEAEPGMKHELVQEETLYPTCKSEGYYKCVCANPNCAYTTMEILSAVDHKYSVHTRAVIEDEQGAHNVHVSRCVWCDEYIVDETPAHDWCGWRFEQKSDGSPEDVCRRKCAVCGAEEEHSTDLKAFAADHRNHRVNEMTACLGYANGMDLWIDVLYCVDCDVCDLGAVYGVERAARDRNALPCPVCSEKDETAQAIIRREWQPDSDDTHSLKCARCGYVESTEPCTYISVAIGDKAHRLCTGCSRLDGEIGSFDDALTLLGFNASAGASALDTGSNMEAYAYVKHLPFGEERIALDEDDSDTVLVDEMIVVNVCAGSDDTPFVWNGEQTLSIISDLVKREHLLMFVGTDGAAVQVPYLVCGDHISFAAPGEGVYLLVRK